MNCVRRWMQRCYSAPPAHEPYERHEDARRAVELHLVTSELFQAENFNRADIRLLLNELPERHTGTSDATSVVDRVARTLRRLDEQHACVVCMNAPRCVVVQPCSHLCLCADCAETFPRCVMCDQLVAERLYVFLN